MTAAGVTTLLDVTNAAVNHLADVAPQPQKSQQLARPRRRQPCDHLAPVLPLRAPFLQFPQTAQSYENRTIINALYRMRLILDHS